MAEMTRKEINAKVEKKVRINNDIIRKFITWINKQEDQEIFDNVGLIAPTEFFQLFDEFLLTSTTDLRNKLEEAVTEYNNEIRNLPTEVTHISSKISNCYIGYQWSGNKGIKISTKIRRLENDTELNKRKVDAKKAAARKKRVREERDKRTWVTLDAAKRKGPLDEVEKKMLAALKNREAKKSDK